MQWLRFVSSVAPLERKVHGRLAVSVFRWSLDALERVFRFDVLSRKPWGSCGTIPQSFCQVLSLRGRSVQKTREDLARGWVTHTTGRNLER